MTLVDTNVLLDVLTNDSQWVGWSIGQLDVVALKGPLVINDIVYAELLVRFDAIEALDTVLNEVGLVLTPTPRAALFLAAKAFQRYRTAGGAKSNVLPDFFIGAHAAVAGLSLLTRDPKRYRTYFPKVDLVAP